MGHRTSRVRQDTGVVSRVERRAIVKRRQVRLVTASCLGLCALVLVTSFPIRALVRQHDEIKSQTAELDRLNAGNKSLQREADELLQPDNIAALARRDYDMVLPGQKAYTVVPSATSPSSNASDGQSTIDQQPVDPGSSQSQDLLGDNVGGSSDSSGADDPSSQASRQTARASHTPGLWGRVLDTLEFWH